MPSMETGHVGARLTLPTGRDETTSFPLSTLLHTFSVHCMHSFPSVAVFSQLVESLQSLLHEAFPDYTQLTMNFVPDSTIP